MSGSPTPTAGSPRLTRSPSMRRPASASSRRLGDLKCPALELGRSSEAKLGDPVTVAAGAGTKPVRAMIVGKQEFAGYWEYFLDEAIFTSPAHPFWGGAGAIDADGRLIGVGSLHVEQLSEKGGPRDINMIVPIDLLPPILDDLLTYGRVNKPARPWLGVFSAENGDEIIVASVAEQRAGGRSGNPSRRCSRWRRRLGDRKSGRFLSQGLEPRPGWGRDSTRNRPRRPGDRLARAIGRPLDLHEAPAPAVKPLARSAQPGGRASEISLTSLRIIASPKVLKSSICTTNAPGPPITFSR